MIYDKLEYIALQVEASSIFCDATSLC